MGADVETKDRLDLLPPSSSAPAGVPVPSKKVRRLHRPKDVERRGQRVSGPDLWRSDFTWDAFGLMAGLHHLLAPLRKPIQALARRYRHRPLVFASKFQGLVERDWQKRAATDPRFRLNIAQFYRYQQRVDRKFKEPPSEGSPDSFPRGLSQKQLEAFAELLPVARRMIMGRPVKVQPKKLLGMLGSLMAQRPGPQLSAISRKIDRLYFLRGMRSPTRIARIVFRGRIRDEKFRTQDELASQDRRDLPYFTGIVRGRIKELKKTSQ